ncbi:CBS domain-containing protein [Desulfovibrio subterraneus]|uniref:Membrane protein n=1 Tax=Desulfovibrio subterraneus TaxID=2718620 RepID=A0A7J0BJY6_9BACT|nr:CBS domain-containing protein [Desulfovibrio subterraneus]WBF68106.1 CBS domain-containing protein [Desulfovibrio subterraneus]GFM33990.1 membrane protein [Desulfovibrio subterraneus]
MLTARDIMSSKVVSVTPDTDIPTAARLMVDNKYNGLPVVSKDGTLVGIICQSDLISQQKKLNVPTLFTVLDGIIPMRSMSDLDAEMRKIAASKVSEAMTAAPTTVRPSTPIDEIASLMVDNQYHSLPVVEDGQVVGIIGKEDILKTLIPG